MKALNVMIVGVGGQGTLLASRVLGTAMINAGYDVKVSEVHGMSQRGGSVVTYVRAGEKVWSPIINPGEADIILSFEQLEALRWLSCLSVDGQIIVNTQKIDPMSVVTGAAVYPEGVLDELKKVCKKVKEVDALALAMEAGTVKAVNIVLIGVMAAATGIDKEIWLDAVRANVPAKFLELNLKAFELGWNHAE